MSVCKPETKEYGNTIETVLDHMVKIITEKFNPIKIILFGSYARGTSHKYSDIDLLVIMPDGIDTFHKAVDIGNSLCMSPMPKDIVVDTISDFEEARTQNGMLEKIAAREGVVLYG